MNKEGNILFVINIEDGKLGIMY